VRLESTPVIFLFTCLVAKILIIYIHIINKPLFSSEFLLLVFQMEAPVSQVNLAHVEADQNTSTVALRVVGGDEKGTQCPGV
jgi:hypothetical protein